MPYFLDEEIKSQKGKVTFCEVSLQVREKNELRI